MIRLKLPDTVNPGRPEELLAYLFELVGDLNVNIEALDNAPMETKRTGVDTQKTVSKGELDMAGNRITGLQMPQDDHDAVTLEYLRQYVAGKAVK